MSRASEEMQNFKIRGKELHHRGPTLAMIKDCRRRETKGSSQARGKCRVINQITSVSFTIKHALDNAEGKQDCAFDAVNQAIILEKTHYSWIVEGTPTYLRLADQ